MTCSGSAGGCPSGLVISSRVDSPNGCDVAGARIARQVVEVRNRSQVPYHLDLVGACHGPNVDYSAGGPWTPGTVVVGTRPGKGGAFPAQVDVDLDSAGPGGPETIETAIALTPVTWPSTIHDLIWLSVDAR